MSGASESTLNLAGVWRAVRRRLPWIVLCSVLLAAMAYVLSSRQPAVYEATNTLLASNSQSQDGVLGTSGVKAPPLPEGVLNQALQGTEVMQALIAAVKADTVIPADEQARLISALSEELQQQRLRSLSLTSRLDGSGNGIYSLRARAQTAKSAQRLADLASASLRAWDVSRALDSIRRAQSGFRAQVQQIDAQLRQSADGIERQTLIARRATVLENLANVNILETSATGVLGPLSSAVEPSAPVSPRPLRNAVLAAILGGLLSIGAVALLSLSDRTIRTEDDLLLLSVPTLGTIPRLRQQDTLLQGIVRAARQTGLYEAIGFLRFNLMNSVSHIPHPVIMVSSTAPGEGKSSLTATLADGFAASGMKVLIIDADLRRGTQDQVWKKYDDHGQWHQLIGQNGARTTQAALMNPQHVQVLQTETNVDLLPAGRGIDESLDVLNKAQIGEAFALWKDRYDVIMVDSAPLLALADGLVLGSHVDGVLMVAEYGRTTTQAVRSALRRAERAGLTILGFAINKTDVREAANYGYSYNYAPQKVTK